MVNANKLKGIITERGMTQGEVAKKLNITGATFYRKLKRGVLGSDEIEILIKELEIEDPISVFFCP